MFVRDENSIGFLELSRLNVDWVDHKCFGRSFKENSSVMVEPDEEDCVFLRCVVDRHNSVPRDMYASIVLKQLRLDRSRNG